MQPLVSIITPAYNEEQNISRCIESVLAQTYSNWEYTIADNCSTDKTCEVAERYANKDSRIRISRSATFVSAIANFNRALRQMAPQSKYCKMVFADDLIFPDCLRSLVETAEQHPSAGVIGAYGMKGSQEVWCTGVTYPDSCISGREVCRRYFLEDGFYVFGTSTSVLYRSDLVRSRDPFFDESNLHCDIDTCLALLKSSDFGFVHQVLSFTRLRQNSLFAFSTRVNTIDLGRLHDLVTHGPDYLTAEELQRCRARALRDYYRHLSECPPWHREREFWRYHRSKLAELGLKLNFSRILVGSAIAHCVALLRQLRSSLGAL